MRSGNIRLHEKLGDEKKIDQLIKNIILILKELWYIMNIYDDKIIVTIIILILSSIILPIIRKRKRRK